MRQARQNTTTASHAEHIQRLATAIDTYRAGNRRRRLSRELRAQVVATLDAGATVRVVREACKLSGSQITRWRQAAAAVGGDLAPSRAPEIASPRVLSVVDRDTRQDARDDDEIELRIGGWHVCLRRVVG